MQSRLPEKQEANSEAEGDVDATVKDLDGDMRSKEALHHECLNVAEEFQASTANRNAELRALAEAKRTIEDTTGGKLIQAYLAPVSLVQVQSMDDPVRAVRALAERLSSTVLAQLATRMLSARQLSSSADPYGQVRELLTTVIGQLSAEDDSDASLQAYCDKEMSSNSDKEDDVISDGERLNAHIDQASAKGKKLKGVISTLQRQISAMTRAQELARQLREEEHKSFIENKQVMEEGLHGVRQALKLLQEHYSAASDKTLLTQGASGGIIGMLEVVEADLSDGLVALITSEESAASYYQSTVKPIGAQEEVAKKNDVKFKLKEYAALLREGADLSNDASRTSEKLAAISEYEAILKSKCSKPDPFQARAVRREQELSGLKDILFNLSGGFTLVQARSLRGAQPHQ